MTQTSNSKARVLVENRKEFKGNNTFAEQKGLVYFVYSYGYHFPIYAFKCGQWYANRDKYSQSTSKHQSQLSPNNRHEFIFLSTEEMIALSR